MEVFEIIVYEKTDFILQRYMGLLAFSKIKHSPLPDTVKDDIESREIYCRKINEEMNFRHIIQRELTAADLDPNEDLRTFFKNAMNKVRNPRVMGF
jgi:hypothetical protein